MFQYFIWFIIQYIYIIIYCYLWIDTNALFETEKRNGEIDGYTIISTIYTCKNGSVNGSVNESVNGSNSKNKLILFLSGAYNLELHPYIIKTINDILHKQPEISNIYDLVCFENKNVTSLIIYDEVAKYIEDWYMKRSDGERNGGKDIEIVLVGYSAGGVVASHIMSRIGHLDASLKLITYDTPWHIKDNVHAFSEYLFYRMDIIFYYKVWMTYLCHYNYDQISHLMCKKGVGRERGRGIGASEMFRLIQDIHQYDNETFYMETGFNVKLREDVKVINVYNLYDPLVVRDAHMRYFEKKKNDIKFHNTFIVKNIVGHCSDMAFSLEYLDIFVSILFGM